MSKILKPNFFIVGTAKGGTTSIYRYLKQHPGIFLSVPKEPKYFSSFYNEFPHQGPGDNNADQNVIRNLDNYLDLFKRVEDEKIVGEASADYLFYSDAANEIKKFNPNAKVLISLRNPVQRAFSAYCHMLRENRETLSFNKALNLEQERINNNYEFIWYYKTAGLYYTQVKKYLNVFGKENTKIIIFEDFIENPSKVIREIINFLGFDNSYTVNTEHKYNVSGIPKNKFLHNFLKEKSFFKKITKLVIPEKLRKEIKLNLINNNLKKPKMNNKTRNDLIDYFRNDILKLENLLDKDLSNWSK